MNGPGRAAAGAGRQGVAGVSRSVVVAVYGHGLTDEQVNDLFRRVADAAHDVDEGGLTVWSGPLGERQLRVLSGEEEDLVDRVRELADEYLEAPMPQNPEPCEDADEGYCHTDASRTVAYRFRRLIEEKT